MDVPNNNSFEIPRDSLEDVSPWDTSTESSTATSRRGSHSGEEMSHGKEVHQVRFDSTTKPPTSDPSRGARRENSLTGRLQELRPSSRGVRSSSGTLLESRSPSIPAPAITRNPAEPSNSRGKLPVRRRADSQFILGDDEDIELAELTELDEIPSEDTIAQQRKARSQQKANSQAQNLRREMEDSGYEQCNRNSGSGISSPAVIQPSAPHADMDMPFDPIDLNERLENAPARNNGMDETEGRGEGQWSALTSGGGFLSYIRGLIGRMKSPHSPKSDPRYHIRVRGSELDSRTGEWSPNDYGGDPAWYVPPPKKYRAGVVASWMKFYQDEALHGFTSRNSSSWITPNISPLTSGANTPLASKSPLWYKAGSSSQSNSSFSNLISASTILAQSSGSPALADIRPQIKRGSSSGRLGKFVGAHNRSKSEQVVHIRIHNEESSLRYQYVIELCHALMAYGAPTHRLEGKLSFPYVLILSPLPTFTISICIFRMPNTAFLERPPHDQRLTSQRSTEYMRMTCHVFELDGRFLFIPGCMLVSFVDRKTQTSDVRIVRNDHSVDLSKLLEMHTIYKRVNHDKIGATEGSLLLKGLFQKKVAYGPWTLVLFYGLASAFVGPFAFGARLIDMPMAFLLGCLLGVMKIIVSPKSELYSNIFEVSAAVATSFLARALGSIKGGDVFCFSALAQSSIALILPGYTVLCGALELQSRNIVAGSVHMVYAIIYSLFLGFGITIGTSFYGGMDRHATSETVCQNPISGYWKFFFIPPFTICLIVINQGKPSQMPVMVLISLAGYVVNFFSSLRFPSNVQVSQTLGALTIGLMGNFYSRIWEGVSAAALLPAIFVQVPSGLAASGSLISGLTSANQIISGANGTTTVSNGTQAGNGTVDINSTVFNVAYSMIQVSIGITVGLFLSVLIVYPLGKKRSGLFSF
ncbi:hypothetical protein MMC18_002729 [Xylographa bjoerkii]|nr:hypothetical protein [Xylographa bjoerkii]